MSAKVLITGMANTGKTTLLKTLKNTLVVSRDGKPFSLELPHFNMPDYESINELLDTLNDKMEKYKEKIGDYPETIVFDSVSRIFTDIETNCIIKYEGFKVWDNVNKEINLLLEAINSLQENGFNIILIAHTRWDENAKRYIETCKGSFAKIGGFLSTVDYALNIDVIGSKYIITHRGSNLSRTLLENIPDKQNANEFNLQNYIEEVNKKANTVSEKWSI